MRKFAFISRHEPTDSQIRLAAEKGIELIHVGDRDGFTVSFSEFKGYDGVVVVHAAMALRLLSTGNYVGVFNNVNRSPIGEKPQFEATEFHIYSANDCFVAAATIEPICREI